MLMLHLMAQSCISRSHFSSLLGVVAIASMGTSGCAPSSRERSFGTVSVSHWRIEVMGREWEEKRTRDFHSYTAWNLAAKLVVEAASDAPRELGAMLGASEEDSNASTRPLFDSLKLASCSLSDGRIAFRLDGAPTGNRFAPSPGYWIGYATPSTFFLARERIEAGSCEEALKLALPMEEQLRKELASVLPIAEVNDPLARIGRLAIKGVAMEDVSRSVAFAAAIRGELASDAALSYAVSSPDIADDAAMESSDNATGKSKLHFERKALIERIAQGGVSEGSLGIRLLGLLTPNTQQSVFPVASSDYLGSRLAPRIAWVMALVQAVPKGPERDRAMNAILEGCRSPESRVSCTPFSAWAIATLARESSNQILCNEVLGLVPGLLESKVSALEWTVLGLLRGVGPCGSIEQRVKVASAALSPSLPELSAQKREPNSVPQRETIDTSPQTCHLGIEPLALGQCHSLPGFARAILQEACSPDGIAAAKTALARPKEDWVIRGEAICVLMRCSPDDVPSAEKIGLAELDRKCPRSAGNP